MVKTKRTIHTSIITRVLGSIEARMSQPWFNPLRTVYFNFRTLPFRQAIKFPVYIYGRVRFFMLNGRVRFENTPIKRGMVKIGINGDSFSLFDHTGYIQLSSLDSEIIFEGIIRKTKRATPPERNVPKIKRNVRLKQNEAYHRCAFFVPLQGG